MKKTGTYNILFTLAAILLTTFIQAQRPGAIRDIGNRARTIGNPGNAGSAGRSDSLRRRNNNEDSITVSIYYLDSVRAYRLDSNMGDYTRRYPIPGTHIYLGNVGSATRSLLFAPPARSGFDPGFHAFDVYKWKLETVRFYNTTRPLTELSYTLGSGLEQQIELLHTQNIKPYWNAAFHYRLINAPGIFKSQKTNHNNLMLTSWYQAPKKRYNNYFVILNNKIQAGESGGMSNDQNYLDNPLYADDRFTIPVNIGGSSPYTRNPFNTNLLTGNRYTELTALMRQQYDLGRKDSIVTDSTVIPLFYPRLRFEHTLRYGAMNYQFLDFLPVDSSFFISRYDTSYMGSDSFQLADRWKVVSNDFSIYTFPDAKNLQQFLKAGIEHQVIRGFLNTGNHAFFNIIGHGEYRNRTRNAKWDMLAFGKLHLGGYNAGDYHAYVSLQRLISPRLGTLQAGFENINRSPTFQFDRRSSFYLDDDTKSFGKENTAHIFGRLNNDRLRLQLGADYYLVSNYLYVKDYFKLEQENALFNVLRLSALKTIKISKHWNWHAEVYLQQKTGATEVNFPSLYTRNRIAYEGSFGFKNLDISTGTEIRYHTPYKADNYSPVLGEFFYQDSVTISNLPDIHAFVHFRIKAFRAYFRLENLNTARVLTGDGFGFSNNNLAAPGYPTPGLLMRFGIYWTFVN